MGRLNGCAASYRQGSLNHTISHLCQVQVNRRYGYTVDFYYDSNKSTMIPQNPQKTRRLRMILRMNQLLLNQSVPLSKILLMSVNWLQFHI